MSDQRCDQCKAFRGAKALIEAGDNVGECRSGPASFRGLPHKGEGNFSMWAMVRGHWDCASFQRNDGPMIFAQGDLDGPVITPLSLSVAADSPALNPALCPASNTAESCAMADVERTGTGLENGEEGEGLTGEEGRDAIAKQQTTIAPSKAPTKSTKDAEPSKAPTETETKS